MDKSLQLTFWGPPCICVRIGYGVWKCDFSCIFNHHRQQQARRAMPAPPWGGLDKQGMSQITTPLPPPPGTNTPGHIIRRRNSSRHHPLMNPEESTETRRQQTWTGHAAPSASAQIVWPSTCLLSSHSMSISSGRALPVAVTVTFKHTHTLYFSVVLWRGHL